MSKSAVEFTCRRITYETTLPIAEVLARLDKESNKEGAGPEVVRALRNCKTREELETTFAALSGGGDFVYAPYRRRPGVARPS